MHFHIKLKYSTLVYRGGEQWKGKIKYEGSTCPLLPYCSAATAHCRYLNVQYTYKNSR